MVINIVGAASLKHQQWQKYTKLYCVSAPLNDRKVQLSIALKYGHINSKSIIQYPKSPHLASVGNDKNAGQRWPCGRVGSVTERSRSVV
jgi:hypothetical protein